MFAVRVSQSRTSDTMSSITEPWHLGLVPSKPDLEIGKVTTTWWKNNILKIEWDNKRNVNIQIHLFSETGAYDADEPFEADGRNGKIVCSFASRNPDFMESGNRLVLFYMVRSGAFVGEKGRVEVVVP